MSAPKMTLAEAREKLPPMWTVYDHPRDCPQGYVVRVWYGECCELLGHAFPTLGAARQWIVADGGSVPIPRSEADDSVILETWI